MLTVREREVLALVAAGMTNHQIGDELTISLNTVSHHLRAIFAKTSSRNRTEAAAFAHQHGLVR
jgi:DNA-binding NarL/FixJ family response regulator